MINMGYIQTHAQTKMLFVTYVLNVLSSVKLTTRLEKEKKKWRVMFHTCANLFPYRSAQGCSCEFYETSQIHLFKEHTWVTVGEQRWILFNNHVVNLLHVNI